MMNYYLLNPVTPELKFLSIPEEQKMKYEYNSGFGNEFATEALKEALPIGQNSPQKVPYGLYAEQLSGTAFTVPRHDNQRRPSVVHEPFQPLDHKTICKNYSPHGDECECTPNQLRWSPFAYPTEKLDFIQRAPETRAGLAIHVYCATKNMTNKAMFNSDGDLLIVPQEGAIDCITEMGKLFVSPGEIMVIPRGIRFQINFPETQKGRGYVLEVFDRHFEIPDLGPIGANGLANPRDFLHPVACYEDLDVKYEIVNKYQGQMFNTSQNHSPFDVVAWHGNYTPYKYDLKRFNAVNSVTFDHSDPSIFTVLTVKSGAPGVALADFVVFPPRWVVAENTFRPPYYHRNCMSEFMGLISGQYDAKKDGFKPGGASLHSIMTAHGPDRQVFEASSLEELKPVRYSNDALAFMFESNQMMSVTKFAHRTGDLQQDYYKCWQGLGKYFDKMDINAGPK